LNISSIIVDLFSSVISPLKYALTIDCNFSERTFGILADYLKLDILIMTSYFHKINGGRK
jgi:hypothetical protein